MIATMLAKLVLAFVFGAAGIAKLADRKGTGEMLIAFGAPASVAPWFVGLLPAAELSVAIGLLVPLSAWGAAIAAILTLFAFTAAIAFNLARGRRPSCNCFGQIQAAPIGVTTLFRNIALVVIATLVIVSGPSEAGVWSLRGFPALSATDTLLSAFAVAGLVLLGVMALLLLQMMRQQGRLLLRLDALEASFSGAAPAAAATPDAATIGLPIGRRAPEFKLADSDGAFVTLGNPISAGRPLLLLFSNPSCGPCTALAPEVDVWQREYDGTLDIARISEGAAKDNRGHGRALLQIKREVADAYQCWGTPGAVLIRPDGTIGSFVAQGGDAIRALVTRSIQEIKVPHVVAAPFRRREGLYHGEKPAPFTLTGQDGRSIALQDYLGQNVLLLFWNPDCGFCQRMLPTLQAWDAAQPEGAPALIVVSTASPARNREMGLSSPVVEDAQSQVSAIFGARGTPMAVLLDGEGRVASGVAAGADAVMALAAGAQRMRRIAAVS